MNDNAALNLIKNTFENSFDRERFLIFAKNLFHFLDTDAFIYRGNLIPDAYDAHIKTLERLGKYEDVDGHKIEVLAVCLNKQSALERARTLQRNFIAWYLNGSRGGITKDAALVAFYTKDSDDWRLSLVKMDYHLGESKAGKIKAITELTPARRFSFLVGANENTHTAQRQLLSILKDTDFKPALSDLESAFSVEVVTKDFFEKYKKLFLDTKEALDARVAKDTKIKADFQEKNIDTADFAKKLLGQIVFLYFLQKKGWFGVARDADWGTGPKDFLRRLFKRQLAEYDNFFNNILEPLFYEALAIERTDDFYSKFNCKIPFLNGGLFDPLGNYDWVHTDICLPDKLFSNNRKTKEGDTGDGILDVFDRYNFTVKEDEPLEREVAVDPEMLGKVFENLLEVKDRKSKGTYYTPREIVHYMCQESLVNYLLTELDNKVKRDDIETLIRLGETAIEHDKVVLEHGEEKGRYTFKLPQSIRDNANLLDEKLEKIHVCDPAVGSGAFLVGMMTEIVRARHVLSSYIGHRPIYDFKRNAIQNCLYGVDIDPGAVEIAKLRLWLSLIVDEEDIRQIKPLPNLDYKIMQGNSLLEEYEGVKLDVNGQDQSQQMKFDQTKTESEILKEKLVDLRKEFFKTAHKTEKDALKKQIEDLTWQLIEVSLKEQKKLSLLPEIERFKKANIKPFFLWKLNFSEIFEKNGGFDVVIANPPWVSVDNISKKEKSTFSEVFFVAKGRFDLSMLFVEQSIKIIAQGGVITFVLPEHIWIGQYFSNFRQFLAESSDILEVVSLKEGVFDEVANPSSVLICEANKNNSSVVQDVNIGESKFRGEITKYNARIDFKEGIIFDSFAQKIKSKISKLKLNSLGEIALVTDGIQTANLLKTIFTENPDDKNRYYKALRSGKEIPFRYGYIRWSGWWVLKPEYTRNLKRPGFSYDSPKRLSCFFAKEKIILRQTEPTIVATLDSEGFYFPNSIFQIALENNNHRQLMSLLALLNSKFIRFYYKKLSQVENTTKPQIYLNILKSLPVLSFANLESLSILADRVLSITKDSDFLQDEAKQEEVKNFEHQVDQLVYKLYGLTPEEIRIIENKEVYKNGE